MFDLDNFCVSLSDFFFKSREVKR